MNSRACFIACSWASRIAFRTCGRQRHEQQIEAALADYYQATAAAERIRAAARRKADSITAATEQSAAQPVAAACDAVCRLRDLLGGNAEVAELCDITAAKVRELVAAAARYGPDDGGGDGDAA
jgi:hypothetical protein